MSDTIAKATNQILELPDINLAAREWGPADGYPLLALHGWLDNSATYEPLIGDTKWLHDHNLRFIALDLAGHGYSEHRPKGAHSVFLDNIDDVHQTIKQLELDKPLLLGHSMGGGIATLYAGSGLADLAGLMLIESLGPVSNTPKDAPIQLAKHLKARHRHAAQEQKLYEDITPIIKLRAEKSKLPEAMVALILERNMNRHDNGYTWRSDPRLRIPSASYMTHEQIEAFVANIDCSTFVIYATDGPWPNYPILGERAELLKDKQMVGLTGGHHLHMTNAIDVRKALIKYIANTIR